MRVKRLLSILLSFVLSISLISFPAYVFAEEPEQNSESSSEEEDSIPDDVWEGEYVEYKGKDGTLTRVFDSGSVATLYSDGSWEGVDYKGNIYQADKEGNEKRKFTDGTSGLVRSDGTKEYYPDDEHTIVYHSDGTSTQINNKTGLCIDYDQNDKEVSEYFEGGTEKLYYDEDGYLPDGEYEIHGPNGEKLIYKNIVNEEGDVLNFSFSIEGRDGSHNYFDGKRGEDGEYNVEASYPDGTKLEGSFKGDEDEDAAYYSKYSINYPDGAVYNFLEKNETKTYMENGERYFESYSYSQEKSFKKPDGDEYEETMNFGYDENGFSLSASQLLKDNEGEFKYSTVLKDGIQTADFGDGVHVTLYSEGNDKAWQDVMDGKMSEEEYFKLLDDNKLVLVENEESGYRFWKDPNSNATELINPACNAHIKMDENGDIVQYDVDDDDTYMHFENGIFTGKNKKTDVTIVSDISNKTNTVITSDGTVYLEKDGKVWKNNEIVKENGEWLPGEEKEFEQKLIGTYSEEEEELFRPKAEQVVGAWQIDLTFGNMSSMFLDALEKALQEIFPEADVHAAIESEVNLSNQTATINTYMDVKQGTGKNDINAILYIYDDEGNLSSYKYSGTIKKGKMKLKLQGQSSSETSGLETLTFDCYGQGDKIYMDGTFELKSFMLNADVDYYGNLQKEGDYWNY